MTPMKSRGPDPCKNCIAKVHNIMEFVGITPGLVTTIKAVPRRKLLGFVGELLQDGCPSPVPVTQTTASKH